MLKRTIYSLVALGLVFESSTVLAQQMAQYSKGRPTSASLFYNAAVRGDNQTIQTLIQKGYSLNAEDRRGNTALCMAKIARNQKAYNLLIENGASDRVNCMKFVPAQQNAQAKSSMIYLNSGLSDTTYSEDYRGPEQASSFVWKPAYTMVAGGVLLVGGIAAIAAGGGGGGGGGAAPATDTTNVLSADVPACLGGTWVTNNGVVSCTCSDDKVLINGACVLKVADSNGDGVIDALDYQTASVTNSGTLTVASAADALKAELGGSASNSGTILGTTSGLTNDLVGIEVNGFSSASYSGTLAPDTKLNVNTASYGSNAGTIELSQGSSVAAGRLFGIKALAGAVAINQADGQITLNGLYSNALYGMYAEEVSYGLQNDGNIQLNLSQNALNAYGIYAPKRGVVNNGTLTTVITNPTFNAGLSGDVAAVSGTNVKNIGSILLRRGETAGNTINENNLNFYGMQMTNGGYGTNTGMISLDVTKTPYYIYGMYANQGTSSLLNQGRIEIYGDLASKNLPGSGGIGGAYAMRWVGGYGSIVNEGEIETRHWNKDTELWENLSITGSTYVSLLQGFSGSITNKAPLNLFVENNATALDSWTLAGIYLGQNGEGSGILNSSEINVTVNDGTVAAGNQIASGNAFGIFGGTATIQNDGKINLVSNTDNLNLYGIDAGTGTFTNSQYAAIKIIGGGANSALYGLVGNTGSGIGTNAGDIALTHTSSGLMQGAGGSNVSTGTITLRATPTVTNAVSMDILGLGGSLNEGIIDIEASKGTHGFMGGMAVMETLENSGTVSIKLTDRTQADFGQITGLELLPSTPRVAGTVTNSGLLKIDASTSVNGVAPLSGNILGIYADGADVTNEENALIDISLNGSGGIVGIQNASQFLPNESIPQLYTINNKGTLSIKATNTSNGSLTFNNLQSGTTTVPFGVVGIVTNSFAINSGDILLDVSGDAKVAGMVAYDGGMAINTGLIEFKGVTANFTALYGTGTRVFVESSSTTTTEEGGSTKTVTTETTTTQYSTVYNWGRIKINESLYSGLGASGFIKGEDGALLAPITEGKTQANQISSTTTTTVKDGVTTVETSNPDYSNYVGGTLLTTGSTSTPIILNEGVNYVSEGNASFEAEGLQVQGSVIGGTSNVLAGNQLTYVANGSGEGAIVGNGDSSLLSLTSASYLFNTSFGKNASNANGLDILYQMKSFDEVTGNQSLAAFLSDNYARGNNEAFFNEIKSLGTASAFTSAMDKLTGRETIGRFAYEDLSAMRDLNFAMNNAMFAADNTQPVFEKAGVVNTFSFKADNNSSSQYSLMNKSVSPQLRLGYGVAFTNLNTDDDNDNTRRDTMVQFFAPVGYETHGVKMIASPRFGYARGHYTRQGFSGSYEGYLEKRIFGVMNEARYPINLGFMTLEPSVEFNAIGYSQKGREDKKAYSLNIQSDTNMSVEGGFGLYARKEFGQLKVNAGLAYYREFATPYQMRVGMDGMNGSFDLTDDKVSQNRGLATFGFAYDVKDLSIYGNLQHFMENDAHTNFNAGIKIGF